MHILGLFRRRVWAGRHMGARLLANALRVSEALGCNRITLEVMPTNEHAAGAYEAAGFTTYAQSIGPDRSYWMSLPDQEAIDTAIQNLQQLYAPPKKP